MEDEISRKTPCGESITVETVGELRAALEDFEDDTTLEIGLANKLKLTPVVESLTGDDYLEIEGVEEDEE